MMDPEYRYKASLERVIDGDTYRLLVDVGFRCYVSIEARLHGVNCPESNTEEGQKATTFVTNLLAEKTLVIRSYKDQRSFARWVCDVWMTDPSGNEANLTQTILNEGHGVPM